MLVADWMTRDPVTIGAEQTVQEAAALMVRRKVRRLPVLAAGDGGAAGGSPMPSPLVGILSKGDVLGAAPSNLNPFSPVADEQPWAPVTVRTIMSATPVTIGADVPLEVAAQAMIDHKIGGLPVTMGGRLCGILTESDVFRAFAAALGGGRPGLRITFDLAPGEDVVPMVVRLGARYKQSVTSVATYAVGDDAIAVVRLVGPDSPALLDELWKTGHRVRSVLRLPDKKP